MNRTLTWMVVCILTASAAMLLGWNKKEPVAESQALAAPATRNVIAAAGLVEPLSEEIRISSEMNGKIREVAVDEGDRVRRGQVIAVLENADYAARVANADAQLKQREAQLMRVMNGSRAEERREAEAALVEAKAVLEEAEAERRRRDVLFRSGDVARSVLEKAERERAVAKARVDAATERRQLVERASREEDVLSARADVEQARAQLAEARAYLAKTYIRSPIDAVVLRKKAKIGESISTDNPENWIVTVGDDSAWRVRVDVDEADVAKLRVGQPAYVTAEAYGTQRFGGRVVRIGQILGRKNVRTDEPTERVDKKILETLVELDAGQKLPAGLRVDAFIDAAER
ncbi:MAG TPA: HlyD family efflux transporter periplasmic adaptor subunit [Bryobacteraceae bacterium]|nr:HlyD family efflux transporter periplasmic adaptor subunit [Bryobacteraceae bacterium]